MSKHVVTIKRAYEEPSSHDGMRVLVDRLWPRGVSKDEARIDLWLKDVSPSDDLRKWFGHDPVRWKEFQQRYKAELSAGTGGAGMDELRSLADKHHLTLVYSAKDEEHNNAVVLKEILDHRH